MEQSNPQKKVLPTPEQASERYQVPLEYWWGRGKSKPGLPGVVKVGRHVRIDPEAFEQATLDGIQKEKKKRETTVLPVGDYRCIGCGWTGHIEKPRPLNQTVCPTCHARARVERLRG